MTSSTRTRTLARAAISTLVLMTLIAGEATAGPGSGLREAQEASRRPDRPASEPAAAPVRATAAPVTTVAAPLPPTGRYVPSLATASGDVTALHRSHCQANLTNPRLIICVRGDPDGRTTAMLVGASHATQWYPAVNKIARQRGWRLLTAVKGGCKLDLSRRFASTARDISCKQWLEALMARIRRNPPDMIITTGTVTSPTGERLPAGYVDMWRRFDRLGITVIAIRDTPRGTFDRVACLRNHPTAPRRCSIARSPTLDEVNPLLLRDDLPDNVVLADLSDAVCSATRCPAVSGSLVIYRDRHHFTATFARSLAAKLGSQIPVP